MTNPLIINWLREGAKKAYILDLMAPRLTLLAALLFFGLFYESAFAQGVEPFSLSVNPRYPAPFGTAVVTPLSTILDLSVSTMVASVNGTKVYEGNIQPFSITLGAPGTKTEVSVVITSGAKTYTKVLPLVPGDVALVIEPQSSAPPLYPGKPLIPRSGSVRVVAVTDFRSGSGAAISPSTLSYAWTVDDATLQTSSGFGKNSLSVSVPLQHRSRNVTVLVKTADGSQVGGKTLRISGNEPSVRMYESDPLLGVRFERALEDSFSIGESEVSLFGVPYSFGREGGAPTMSWLLNGSEAQLGPSLTLRPQGAGEGSASVSLSARKTATLEQATAALTLMFGASSGGGFFGL